ncbi:caspase family protein [Rhodohalobacter sp. 614A]|uniref:caspase family protein n=1 Tax=Rhodohalobacter sp. 614A TaxID=2908649 RepID=UPI001F1E9B6C
MKTLALVIGNNDYEASAKLTNAVNDANAIAEIFTKLQYDVILKTNCKSEQYSEILEEFENKIIDYDASIFYFAGHGLEIDGENYLAAIDSQLLSTNSKHYFSRTCIRLNEILDILKKHTDKVNIVIMDACRKSFDRSGNIGFSPIQAPRGTLLAFSTSPNEGASDIGFEGNSIYTGSLLRYLGREGIFVEELFKKVRKTVFNLSGGRQTSWEHTSLIGDFYFNTGQLVYSQTIPYDEKVVKDSLYEPAGKFGELIMKVKSYDWDIQNPAIQQLLNISCDSLNKNEKFLLGRNLLQASGAAFKAVEFMENINLNIGKYNENHENHVLNGILFEIYFDSKGLFRFDRTKKHCLENVLQLRKITEYRKSFEFIQNLLSEQNYELIYIPSENDEYCDVDVSASKTTRKSRVSGDTEVQVIEEITYNSIDITDKIEKYGVYRSDKEKLTKTIADFLTAPESLVQIHSNLELTNCETKEEEVSF